MIGRWRSRPAVVAALVVVMAGTGASAQERIAVLTEPGTPVVAVQVLLAVGPADESASLSGIAYLSARSVVEPLRPALDSLGAYLLVAPHKDALAFSLTSAPDAWEASSRLLLEALFRDPPDSAAVVHERRAIAAELRGRQANPAGVAAREMDRAFFGRDHPWSRPETGTPQSIERVTFADVDGFLRANFTPDRAVAAVVGPVDAPDVRGHLRPLLGSAFPAPIEVIPQRAAGRPIRSEYNSITTWVSASFRFPETADEEALRLVAYLINEAISFSPVQRDVYDVRSEVVARVGGGEIRLQLVIPPQDAGLWADRIREAVAELASRSMPADVFAAHLRRYSGERLMQMISPENRAYEAARRLLVEGRVRGVPPELEELTQARMRAAAASLGTPTVVLLGPIMEDADDD